MKASNSIRAALAAAAFTGVTIALPSVAFAQTSTTFAQAQQKIEQQLADRVAQLGRLAADISSSTTLTSAHANLLSARIATETTSINALVAKVPNDTTAAELDADRVAMLRDNRVYAVETPQVIETIEADSIGAQVTVLRSDESSLQESIRSLSGQPGYQNAFNHYDAFAVAVNNAYQDTRSGTHAVLAQVPQDFPGDTYVFVNANRKLLAAGIALAHASYDESVIGLATGGYTGS